MTVLGWCIRYRYKGKQETDLMHIQESASGGGHGRQGSHPVGSSRPSELSGVFSYLGWLLSILVCVIFSLHGKDMFQTHLKKALVSSTWGKQ